jgi:1-acyl-sn-glycerol-3-phosphate acyltransferase
MTGKNQGNLSKMIIFLRSLLFNIFFPLWTILISLFFYPYILFARPKSIAIVGYIWALVSIKALDILCGLKLEVRGEEYIPEMPFIVGAKHQSDLDTIAFHIILKKPVYVLKQELLKLPLFGTYLSKMGMVIIDRAGGMASLKSMIKDARNRIEDQRPVIIFPEGTRAKVGTTNTYHPGIAALYSACDCKILPVALNTGKFWSKGSFIKKPGVFVIEFLPPINPGLKKDEFMSVLQEQIETSATKLL